MSSKHTSKEELPQIIPAFLLNIYVVTRARKLWVPSHPLSGTNAQGWTMACVIFQWEYCELKHGRARMSHPMAACVSPLLPCPPCIFHIIPTPAPPPHTRPQPSGRPLLYAVDGWALHCWAFVPVLACYPGILLFPPHPSAFRSRISKHWEGICDLDQNHTRIKATLFFFFVVTTSSQLWYFSSSQPV